LGQEIKTKCSANGAVPARGSPDCLHKKLQNFESDISGYLV